MTGLQSDGSERQKSSRALKTISEAAELLDVPQHVLRFWETKFPQIKPLKRNGGRRFYRPDDIDTLVKIKFLLYRQGYTIKGAKKVFDDKNSDEIFARLSHQTAQTKPPISNDNQPATSQSSTEKKKEIAEILSNLKSLSRELRGEK